MKKMFCGPAFWALALALTLGGCISAFPAPETQTPEPASQAELDIQEQTASPDTVSAASVLPPDGPGEMPELVPTQGGRRLAELREQWSRDGAIGAVLYLGSPGGGCEPERIMASAQARGYGDAYPFLWEIPSRRLLRTGGSEVCCIMPADPLARVEVALRDPDTGAPGEVLYETPSGEPFWLCCRLDGPAPEAVVTIEDSAGRVLRAFGLRKNRETGRLELPAGEEPPLTDLTDYETGQQTFG